MVDLETIEALYENVGVTAHLLSFTSTIVQLRMLYLYFTVNVSESTARRAGENQEALRDVRGRGGETAGQT